MNAVYQKGELVWAKVSGFPWWPGVIKSVRLKRKKTALSHKTVVKYAEEPQAFIKFIGDHSHIVAPLRKIDKFCNKYHEHSQSRNKEVQKAIELAKKLLSQSKVKVPAIVLYDFLGKKRLKTASQSKEEREERRMSSHRRKGKLKMIETHIKNKKKKHQISSIRHSAQDKALNGSKNDLVLNEELCSLRLKEEDTDDKVADKLISQRKANGIKRKRANLINDDSEYDFSFEYESDGSLSSDNCDELKEIIEHLLKIRIEMRNKESHKHIVEALEDISSVMTSTQHKNTYILTKDLVPVLTAYTLSNNEDIVSISIQLLSLISDRVISESFDMKPKELVKLKKQNYQNMYQISHMTDENKKAFIDKLSSMQKPSNPHRANSIHPVSSVLKQKPTKKPGKPLKLIEDDEDDTKSHQDENRHNQSEDKAKAISDSNLNEETFVSFLLKKLVKDDQIIQKENIDKGIISPSYFYKNVYNKSNPPNDQFAYLRKSVCLKLLNIIKVLLPESHEDNLKKSVLFLEYIARIKDPAFGEQYKEIIDKLYIRIKELTKYPSSNQKLHLMK